MDEFYATCKDCSCKWKGYCPLCKKDGDIVFNIRASSAKRKKPKIRPTTSSVPFQKSHRRITLDNTESREYDGRLHYQCHYCKLFYKVITMDHVVPRSKGGKNHHGNYVCACFKCNNLKGDMDYKWFVKCYSPARLIAMHNGG